MMLRLFFGYSLITDFFSSHNTCFNQDDCHTISEFKTDDLEIDLVRKELIKFVVKSKFFLGQWRKYQK